MMVKRAVGESTDFSRRVAEEIDRAVGLSGHPTAEVITRAGMSRNYYYKRLRGEMPFNTNDIERIADVLGVQPFDLMRRATVDVPAPGKTQDDYELVAKKRSKDRGWDLE